LSKVAITGNASGSGTFTLAAPNSNSDRTLTLPDNTGTIITTASTFAGTGPAFSAYQSSAQTLTSNVMTKIQVQTEEFDTASCFDNVTDYRFTPNVAGYYQVSAALSPNNSLTGVRMEIYKNGSSFKRLTSTGAEPVGASNGSVLIYLNGTTDYVEFYGAFSSGQPAVANAGGTYFQAAMVRAA
jgi:hypothetical protein